MPWITISIAAVAFSLVAFIVMQRARSDLVAFPAVIAWYCGWTVALITAILALV